jgi:hypothetical protein
VRVASLSTARSKRLLFLFTDDCLITHWVPLPDPPEPE